MWYSPDKYEKPVENLNELFYALEGELEDEEAKITLIRFLRNNLTMTVELLTGIRLAPYQEVTLKGMLNRNNALCVWGRGVGKTFTAAIYCIVQTLFEPNTNILIAGPTFRTARFIFNHIENIVARPEAQLLMQAMGHRSKRADEFEWKINGGTIKAIPLNGEKIRGFRASVLVIDEFLLMPEDLIKNVLQPFLVSPQDIGRRIKIRSREDALIREGKMTEAERIEFIDSSKMIALSSASYTFENLYKTYDDWTRRIYSKPEDELREISQIQDEKEKERARSSNFFISQMGWNSIPDYMMDKNIINLAGSEDTRTASFLREYCAQFTDGSDSYFSAKKMQKQTVPDGNEPTLLLRGDKSKKYVLAIDPNFSNSPTSDYFAMCVMELEEGDKTQGVVVHNYAVAGKDLKDHIVYLHYILTFFNIEMICIDYAGYQFIDAANEHELFKKSKINLKYFDFESEKDGAEYELALLDAKRAYNKEAGCIVFRQYFTTDFIRKANETLQAAIDYGKVWFGSRISPNPSAFEKAVNCGVPLNQTGHDLLSNLIEEQDFLIQDTKKQCASIEVKSTAKGVQAFDLPLSFKKDNSPTRPRKDNYTALMLVVWAQKAYWDIRLTESKANETFTPFMV